MAELIGKLISFVFGNHSIIATVIIAMFPVIELKGAIPIGMSTDYWGEFALNGSQAFIFSLIGSCLVVPIIALVFIPLVNWLKKTKIFRNFGRFIDNKVTKHSSKINKQVDESKKKSKTLIKCLLILGFVAVPLPLTGVWTGTCIAVVIGLKFWQTVLSVILGNIVAGLIIVFVCSVFPEIVTILSVVFIAIVIIILGTILVKMFLSKREDKEDSIEESSIENKEN